MKFHSNELLYLRPMKRLISLAIRRIPRKYLQRFAHIVLRILRIFYLGKKVQCPVCEARYRKFMPYGRVSRDNALCPNCLSLERHRLMWLFLGEKTDFFKKDHKLLHIAPELCFIDRFEALKNIEYITADLESPLAKVKMDIHQMPFEDDSYDICFCNHVMEHVDDDHQSMSEIYRCLKPGGWAIIQVPFFPPLPEFTEEDSEVTDPSERERLYGQSDHVRKYGKDYPERLRKVGFTVDENEFVKELDPSLLSFHGLPPEDIIYWCKK